MPFTSKDFELCEAETARLFPALEGRMRPSDPARSINGMFSFTPDAGSIVGESATVRGVWVCEAVWVTHAGGMARQAVEWMIAGEPSYDLAEADANRFYPFQTTPSYVVQRGAQQYREVYDILHPLQQPASPRNLRLTPFFERHRSLGAEFFTGVGWERPQWFEANRTVVPGVTHEWARRTGWAARQWSPVVGAEHLATRERAALFDLTPYVKIPSRDPTRSSFLERICANRIDRPVGTIVYTAMLTSGGGIRCDLTVTRHEDDVFFAVTGGGSGMHDMAWIRAQVGPGEESGSSTHDALDAAWVCGVRARATSCSRSPTTMSPTGDPLHDRGHDRRRGGSPRSPNGSPTWASWAGTLRAARARRARCGTCCGRAAAARVDRSRARRVRLAPAREGLPPLGTGHQPGARPVLRGPRVRGADGQGLPGPRGARGDPRLGPVGAARGDDVRRPEDGRDGQGADLARGPRRRLRDERELRLLDRPGRSSTATSRRTSRWRARRSRSSTSASGTRRPSRTIRSSTRRANGCAHEGSERKRER